MIKRIFSLLCISFISLSALCAQTDFVRKVGTRFYKGKSEQPYYFLGTNLWYAPILASTGEGGDRQRLCAELDSLQLLGIDNLRILVGADAGSKNVSSVRPYLQPRPGELNDTLLVGLDYLLVEMQKRAMVAVIYLTNSWDWSGGYGFYLRETGHGDSPDAHGEGYQDYVNYARAFFSDDKARSLYLNFVRQVVTRTNSLTGKSYRDDPTIMAWQLCNEPRPFGKDEEPAFAAWVSESAALIKSLDPNHLVSTGSEGIIGCNGNELLCQQIHADSNIDYITVHIWPVNWGWASRDRLFDAMPHVYNKSEEYLAKHERMAMKLNKPFVVEEFGYPRDNNFLSPGSPTRSRDAFYSYLFFKLNESRCQQGALAGCNFWGWGGSGRPQQEVWQPGNDFVCDPPHEPQGWYSVFSCDSSTIQIIREGNGR